MMKVFGSDIDGTLCFHDREKYYRPGDLEAIKLFQQQGHLFGVCTGRPLQGINELRPLNLDFYAVSSGAIILDKELNIIEEHPMPQELAEDIFNNYVDKSIIIVQTNDFNHFYTTRKENGDRPVSIITSLEAVKGWQIYSFSIVFSDAEEARLYVPEIREKYPEIDIFQNKEALDVTMKGCSKGQALQIVKEKYQADQSYGIGDSWNDLPLLQQADISFTFHTSPQDVQDGATYIVNSIEEAINSIIQ